MRIVYLAGTNCALAAATTCSLVKPNSCWRTLSGAEAPKVFIPRIAPEVPVYFVQPQLDEVHWDLRRDPGDENFWRFGAAQGPPAGIRLHQRARRRGGQGAVGSGEVDDAYCYSRRSCGFPSEGNRSGVAGSARLRSDRS